MSTLRYQRYLTALAGGVYLAWWFVVNAALPDAFNPIISRLVVCSLFFALFVSSFIARPTHKRMPIAYALCVFILTIHYYYLFFHNPADHNWVVGAYITVLAAGVTLEGSLVLVAYTVLVLICSSIIAYHDPATVVGFPGIVTILILLNVIASLRHRVDEERERRLKAEADKSAADAINRGKMLFLANMSHELRTPLTSIMGFSEILQESSDLQDDSRDLFERISANSQILHQIVEQILTLTESDMRRLGHEESVNIRSVVENELNHLRALIATKGLQVNLEFSGETDTALLADRQHISQMIGNVLNNAVKFTSKGSVTINVSVAPAVLTNAVNVVITIRDTGLGMAKADWERCFDVFTQVKSEYNRSYGGTGIGLTIARKYARAMGGDVSIQESALGLGTVVRISLTLQRAS